jgi:hypothetical protein
MTSRHVSTTQDLGHGFKTDAELVRNLANGEATLVSSHDIVNNVGSKATVDLLGGSGFRLPGGGWDGFQNRTYPFSLASVV